jgi:protein-disulfide isomerase
VRETYGDKVRVVFRDFPLASHRAAPRAAEAARCADEQDNFWEMHDHLFVRGGVVGPDVELRKAATEAVVSTPTFFVNGRMIIGAAAYETFAAAIDEELDRSAATAGCPTVAAGTH